MGRNKVDGKQRAKEINERKKNRKKGASEKSRQREMERRKEKFIVILCRDSS